MVICLVIRWFAAGQVRHAPQGKFVPKVPAARKKREAPAASAEAALLPPAAATGGDEFSDLVQKVGPPLLRDSTY
jgi:hypothetical protein